MTKEERLADISDYVSYLDEVYDDVMKHLDRKKVNVHVLGFSQGTATVARWLCMGRSSADTLIMWAGAFPPDIDYDQNAHRLTTLRKYVVTGDQDEFIPAAQLENHLGFLRKNKLEHTLVTFSGRHEIDKAALLKVAEMLNG
jgi:predicted esterase